MSNRTFPTGPSRRSALLGLTSLLAAAPGLAEAATSIITGTVSYRERIALPPNAHLDVKLLDVSLADAPSRTLAATRVIVGRRMPIPYRLEIDRAAIQPRRSYALQATITVDGKLIFTTTTRHAVFGEGPDMTDIMVERVASAPSPTESSGKGPAGRWLAEDIGGGGVLDRVQTTLDLSADGRFGGSGGCNRMHGQAKIAGNAITFGNVAATMMACTPAAMDQEQKFFAALAKARHWRRDDAQQKLTLLGIGGQVLVVFSRM